jgi:hypothetical protein
MRTLAHLCAHSRPTLVHCATSTHLHFLTRPLSPHGGTLHCLQPFDAGPTGVTTAHGAPLHEQGRVSACTPPPCVAVVSSLPPQAGCPPRTTTPGTRPPPPPTLPPGSRIPSLALVPCTALQRHPTPHLATPTPPLRPLLLPLLHTRTHTPTPTRLLRVAGTSLQQHLRQHLCPRLHPHRMSCRPMLCMGEGTRAGVVEGARAPRLTSRAGRGVDNSLASLLMVVC